MICVYPADCTDFSTNGNGTIEPTSALVTETLNGEYELQLVHPIDDAGKWQRLVEGCTGINQTVQQIYTDMNAAIAAAGGGEIIVGTQVSSTSAWTGVASFSQLTDGQQIVYWLPVAPTSSNVTLELTLSDNSTTGAIPVYYSGTTRLTNHYAAGNAIRLIYKVNAPIDGSTYTGWWADANYDSGNTYDRIKFGNSVVCKQNITWAMLIVGDDTGYWNLAGGSVFNVDHPILYPSSNGTAGYYLSNVYLCYPTISLRTVTGDSSFAVTARKTVYLVGTLSGKMFTVRGTNWLTTNPTDSTETLSFISLGYMYNTYQMYLYPEHTLDITDQRMHHEIYLSDARKIEPEKLKTVIRHPIWKA